MTSLHVSRSGSVTHGYNTRHHSQKTHRTAVSLPLYYAIHPYHHSRIYYSLKKCRKGTQKRSSINPTRKVFFFKEFLQNTTCDVKFVLNIVSRPWHNRFVVVYLFVSRRTRYSQHPLTRTHTLEPSQTASKHHYHNNKKRKTRNVTALLSKEFEKCLIEIPVKNSEQITMCCEGVVAQIRWNW